MSFKMEGKQHMKITKRVKRKPRSYLQVNCWKLGHLIIPNKKYKSLKNSCRKYNYRLVKDYL
jgi:hypothetical protein